MDFHASFEGMDDIARIFERAPELVEERLTSVLHTALLPVVAEAAREAPADVGTLRASLVNNGVQVHRDGSQLVATIGPGEAAQPYAAAQEFGWKATGSSPGGYPIGELQAWVHRHSSSFPALAAMYKYRKTKAGQVATGRRAGVTIRDATEQELGIAYRIWAKIKAGTAQANEPKHYLTDAWEAHRYEVQAAIQKGVDDLRLAGG